MSFIVFFVLFLAMILSGPSLAQSNTVHYSVIAAKAIRPSSVYNVTATCYNVAQDVHLTLRLQSSNYSVLVEKVTVLQNGVTKIVSLVVPERVPATYYNLVAVGTGGYNFSETHSVSVKRKTLSIFVQTDKAMYKPGQTVLFRAIAVYPDLKPYQRDMDIVIYDPNGNKIMQWLRQQNDSGVVGQHLLLSKETKLGVWKIIVTAAENTYTKTFEVAEYVLSKFEVSVILPSYYLVNLNRRDLQEDLKITVVAKYTYGQPVKGRANFTIQLKPFQYYDNRNYTRILRNVQLVEGKGDISLTIDDLVSLVPRDPYDTNYWRSLSSRSILVVASVNETLTGEFRTANATVPCNSQKYSLTFLKFSPSNFKPGLVYRAVIRLAQSDGSAPDVADITQPGGAYRSISIEAMMSYPPKYMHTFDGQWYSERYTPTYKYFNVTIDPSGYMAISFVVKYNNVGSISLQPSFYINVTNSTVYGHKLINAFKSRDNQCIQVTCDCQNGQIKAPVEVRFSVTTTVPITTFQYEILSKGNILLSDNVVGNASSVHSFSIWISKELAVKLAPSVRVFVWFITNSGEIIADSTELSVSDYFANNVSLSFDRESTTPSQNVSLTVNAYQGSYVGLLAVDQSVLLLKGGNEINRDMVSEELTSYDPLSPPPPSDIALWYGYWWWPVVVDGTDTTDLVSNAGLLFITDGYFYTYSYQIPPPGPQPGRPPGSPTGPQGPGSVGSPEGPPMGPGGPVEAPSVTQAPMQTQTPSGGGTNDVDNTQPRVNFPETWLWTEAITGPDGRVTLSTSVPDTITSWVASAFAVSQVAGFGIAANKAKLTVFKQFFLSPNLPYSVIRGEQTALEVNVFNYMSTRLNVLVSLSPSNDYKVQGSTSKLATVESNDAVSVYFWIVPGSLGQIPIDISAQSPVAGDAIRVLLLVKPEGVKQQYSTSLFIQLSASVPTYNNSLHVSLPPVGKLVPGSEYIEVIVVGDLMGPSIKGLDNLLQMPHGCGEQNMLNFAPNVYIVKYLTISNQLTADIKRVALGLMNAGYQNELNYQKSDGSFSAFISLPGSIWLSAFVIKCFHQAKEYIPVEDGKLARTMRWIIANQAVNGSFAEPPLGKVLFTAMQGGSSAGLPLTAYVLTSLLENRNNSQIDSTYVNTSIALARRYLEDQVFSAASDPYALSIIAYALVRANSSKVSDVLLMLEALAKVEAGTRYWEKKSDTSNASQTDWHPPYSQARSINIEMTSYVLLTYCQLKNLSMSLPIARWIIAQRNANGGFSSTQDTVIALEALAEFASMILGSSGERNLQVSIATDSVQHSFLPITDEMSILLQSYELPSETTKVLVLATGNGSVLVQLIVKYNVYTTDDSSGINLHINTTQNGNKITIKSCSSWNKTEKSGMVVMEINHLTGFKDSNVDANKVIQRVENSDEKVVLYFDELTSNETCVNVTANKVFPVSNVKDAPVKVYPYYDPSSGRTMFYGAPRTLGQNSACTECPECCTGKGRVTPTILTRSPTTSKKLPISVASRRRTPSPKRPTAK